MLGEVDVVTVVVWVVDAVLVGVVKGDVDVVCDVDVVTVVD